MSDRRTVIFKAGYWYHEVVDNKTLIHVGGRTQKNESVHLIVDHFTPFVYVELPKRISWDKQKCKMYFDYLKGSMIDKKTMKNDGPLTHNPVQKYKLYHKKLSYFLYLSFPNEYSAKKLVTKMGWRSGFYVSGLGTFQADEFKVHEHNIDSIIKFTTLNMITLSGWIKAKEYMPSEDEGEMDRDYTSADISIRADWADVNPVTLKTPVHVPPKYCSFDIECYSKNKNSKLPDASIPENVCNQICMTFGVLGDSSRKRILLTLGNPKNVENTDELRVHGYDEASLLLDFKEQILMYNPDIFMGYNTMKFDWGYLIKRAEFCGIFSEFSMLSRIFGKRAELKKMKWSSSAYGEQDFAYLECHGRTNVDLLIEVERNFRLPTYSLNAVSDFFQIGTKDDLSPRDLFMLWDLTKDVLPLVVDKNISLSEFTRLKNKVINIFPIRKCGNLVKEYRKRLLSCRKDNFCSIVREAMAIMGKYCVQDTVLVVDLAEKLNIWTTMEEMSNVTNIPISYLQTRGQQIRVLAQVYRETIRKNMIIPFTKKKNDHEKFQGAMVVEANAGEYVNVSTLDFASLYPSLIIAYNICYTTLLEPNDPTPDSECHVLIWEDHKYCIHDPLKRKGKKEDILCKSHHYRFRKIKYIIAEDGTVTRENEGLLPRLERNLLATRKVYKKDMAKAEAKVKMNSGKATEGDLAWFKKCGYDIIQPDGLSEKDAKLADVDFGVFNAKQLAVKISANSVGGNTPIPCLVNGKLEYKAIEELFSVENYRDHEDGIQLCDGPSHIKVWSDEGWADIKYVGRHLAPTSMHRVLTHTGCVDVTTDHSLLDPNGNEVTAVSSEIGDKLMHFKVPLPKDTPKTPQYLKLDNDDVMNHELLTKSTKTAFVHGMFFAEGTCGSYGAAGTAKNSWCIYNEDLELLNKCRDILNEIHSPTNLFEIYDPGPRQSKLPDGKIHTYHVYNLKAQKDVVGIVAKYRSMFYNNRKEKVVPNYIHSADYETRLAFFVGYYAGDGNRNLKKGIVISNKGQLGSAALYNLANSLGYKVSVSYSNDKNDLFRLQCSTKYRITNITAIKSIKEAPVPPPIRSTKKDVVRNGVLLEKNDEGCYMYNDTLIKCQRLPRQKLLDSIDSAQVTCSNRGRIVEYHTKTKKVVVKCDECDESYTLGLRAAHLKNDDPQGVCKCKNKYFGINQYETKERDEKEYVYDIETSTHHFAAGVGDMIVHNSMYGALGVQNGFIPLMSGAASVTAMGRRLITMAIEFIRKTYSYAKLVYGDSVSSDTPILCMLDGKIFYRTIDNLPTFNEYLTDGEKEYVVPVEGLKVWTEKGFTRINKIIRHKTSKKMFRVLTHTGLVDVTEDHSLLNENAEKVQPKNVKAGDKLLHSDLPLVGGNISNPDAYKFGLCCSKERSGNIPDEVFEYDFSSRKSFFEGYYISRKSGNEIACANLYLLANSLGYSMTIDLSEFGTCEMNLATEKHPDKIKKIVDLPRCDGYVYDLETENHHFSAGIGRMIVHNTDSCMIHFENKTILECFTLAEEASDRATHHLKCFITGVNDDYTVGPDKKPIADVKSTEPYFKLLTYEEKCHVLDYESSPIDLEFENMYGWFLLLTKKRYMAEKVNKKGEVTGETLKGNVLTRRDNSKYLKDTYRELKDKNKKEDDCIIALCDRINMLFTRQIPDLHLIIYMGIKSLIDYAKSIEIKGERQTQKVFIDKNKDPIDDPMGPTDPRLVFSNIPQVLLALKMSRRGEIIPPNTRLEFLYLCNDEATHQGEKAEDFTYYKENKDIENLKPDYLHYIEKQLSKPVTELMNVRFPKPIIPYIDPEFQLRKYLDMFTDLQRYRVANLKVYVKPRPEPNKSEMVGWNVLKKEGYKHRLKNMKLGDDLEYTEYKFKNDDARIAYIMDQIKNGKSANDISETSYPGLLSFCQKWKSVKVIDKKYKENGLTRRRWRKPTYIGPKIRVGSNVVLLTDHGAIKKDTICKIINREDIGKGKSMTYIYDLCCEKTEVIEKNVPRAIFTTFVTKGDTMMKNILEYRINYREVVEQLDSIFQESFLNFC
jgi:DNA polymerase elongation subunit (family B)